MKNLFASALALSGAFVFSATANAGQFEGGLLGHYTWEDSDREFYDDAAGISVDGLYIFNRDTENEGDTEELGKNGVSLRYTQTLLDADESVTNARDAVRSALHVGWWRYFDEAVASDENDDVRGYFNLAIGVAHIDGNQAGIEDTGVSALAALGVVTRNGFIWDNLKLRAEVRADYDDVSDGVTDLSAGIGFHWTFAVAAAAGSCEAAPAATGSCAALDVLDFTPVHFSNDRSANRAEDQAKLDALADAMNQQDDLLVELVGHADSNNDTEYNLELSRKRAGEVRAYLIDKGVDSDRIKTFGLGEYVPVDSNATPEGRANNRRVEFYLRKR